MCYVCEALCYLNRSMQNFVMVCNTAVKLHLEKLLNFIAINPNFSKKLWVLSFWSGFSEDVLMCLWIYYWQKIILQYNSLLMVNRVERVWVSWVVRLDTEGKIYFGLPKFFPKNISISWDYWTGKRAITVVMLDNGYVRNYILYLLVQTTTICSGLPEEYF